MSLILDALRKADAERERGAVPSLHSHPVIRASDETSPKPRGRPNLLWIAIGAAVGLLGAVAIWVIVGRGAPPVVEASRVQPAPAAASVVPQSSPPSSSSTAASQAIGAAQPPAAPAVAPASPAVAASEPAPVAEPAPWRAPDERKPARADAKTEASVPVLGNVPPSQSPVYSRDQLPPEIRAQLPQFTIGGSIYSPVPSGRSLIVNGQLFRERDRLTPDLTLEEIGLKAAVFSFRGYRFEVLF